MTNVSKPGRHIILLITANQGMVWNGRRFFHIPYWQFSSIPFPFHTKNLPFHIPFYTKIFFHIPFHASIPRQKASLDRKLRVICIVLLQPGPCQGSPKPPGRGGPSQNWGPTFYFTTTTLKVGIVDQS